MNVGVDSYSYHRFFGDVYHTQEDPGVRWDMIQLVAHVARFGVDGVVVDTCMMPSLDLWFLRRLRRVLDEAGLQRAVAWGHPNGLNVGKSPEMVDDLRRHIEVMSELATPVLRIVGGSYRTAHEPHGPQIERLANILGDLAVHAKRHGVQLAIENHQDFTADELLALIAKVGSAAPLYVTYDTGNALRVGDDPVEAAAKLAPHVVLVHLKDIGEPLEPTDDRRRATPCVPIGRGKIDVRGVFAALARAGFAGLYAIEIDSPRADMPDEDDIIAESLRFLRSLPTSG